MNFFNKLTKTNQTNTNTTTGTNTRHTITEYEEQGVNEESEEGGALERESSGETSYSSASSKRSTVDDAHERTIKAAKLAAQWDGNSDDEDEEQQTVQDNPTTSLSMQAFLGLNEPEEPRVLQPQEKTRHPVVIARTNSDEDSPDYDSDNPMFFDGDVETFADRILQSTKEETNDEDHEYKRLRTWVMCTGAGPPPPSLVNHRRPTAWENAMSRYIPDVTDTIHRSTIVTPAKKERAPGGKERDIPAKTEHKVKRGVALSLRATEMADKIKDDPGRIVGLLGSGGNNRKWATAVARAVLRLGVGDGTLAKWSRHPLGRRSKNAKSFALSVKDMLTLWANNGQELATDETPETAEEAASIPAGPLSEIMGGDEDLEGQKEAMEAFARLAVTGDNAPSMRAERICPYCLFSHLAGTTAHDQINEPERELSEADLWTRLEKGAMNMGWLHAAAQAHNKEMHSTNGNIDAPGETLSTRVPAVTAARAMFWDAATIQAENRFSEEVVVERALIHQPSVYVSRSTDSANTAFANAGTLYQYFADFEEYTAEDDNEEDPVSPDPSDVPAASTPQPAPSNITITASESDPAIIATTKERLRQVADLVKARPDEPGKKAPSQRQIIIRGILRSVVRDVTTVVKGKKKKDDGPDDEPPDSPEPSAEDKDLDVEHFNSYAKKMKWIAVGVEAKRAHGRLELSGGAAPMIEAATKPTPSQPGLINPSKGSYVFGYLANTPLLAAGIDRAISAGKEYRMLQPTGVDYAWAEPRVQQREVVTLNKIGLWHYDAIFVSIDVLEDAFRKAGRMRVGGEVGAEWSLSDPRVQIIPLGENDITNGVGRDAWILSHLTYPMAWVIEQHTIHTVGDADPVDKLFARTAGLVDINSKVDKIVFVAMSKTSNSVQLGDTTYTITQTDHRGNMHRDEIIPIRGVDRDLARIIEHLLTQSESLRDAYSIYTSTYFPKGINWLEINSLSVALTVRWHQRMEGYTERRNTRPKYLGAPRSVLEAYDLAPADEITDDSYPSYGGNAAVNGLDHRFVNRKKAVANPALRIGEWTGVASLALASGYAIYDTYNVESPIQVMQRKLSGGLDRMMRGAYLRKGFEQWKRAAAQTDRIAFPHVDASAINYWPRLIFDPRSTGGTTVNWFAEQFVTEQVSWCWNVNMRTTTPGTSLTGIRTLSSWWRSQINTEWCRAVIASRGREEISMYKFDDTPQRWTNQHFVQFSQGEDDPELEQLVYRLDMCALQTQRWDLCYKDHPHGDRKDGLTWVTDSTIGGILARDLGWTESGSANPPRDTWGWGVQVRIKDYGQNTLKTLVIPRGTATVLTASHFSPGTVLLRGSREQRVSGLQQHYLDRAMGLEVPKLGARATQQGDPKSRGTSHAGNPDDKILALEKEIEALRAAATAAQRVAKNAEEEPPIKGLAGEAIKSGELIGRDAKDAAVVEEERGRLLRKEVTRVAAIPETHEEHGRSEEQATLEDATSRRT